MVERARGPDQARLPATGALVLAMLTVTFAALPACASAGPAADGKPFHLKVDESANIEGADFRLGFEDVTGDSRCPKDVQCVWAGEATVVLRVETSSEKAHVTLAVPPGGGASQTFRDTVIRIVGLEPQTESRKRIARDDYVVEVAVEARKR